MSSKYGRHRRRRRRHRMPPISRVGNVWYSDETQKYSGYFCVRGRTISEIKCLDESNIQVLIQYVLTVW